MMKYHIISIFPEIFEGFINTSLIQKAIQNNIITINFYNPRNFTKDKHQQIDDEIYWWGQGMLMKAKPLIDCTNYVISSIQSNNFIILYTTPSKNIFDQQKAIDYSQYDEIIIICGRYEGVDYRFEKYFQDHYPNKFSRISIGKYILTWGEIAWMVLIDSISRLIPWVIKETQSIQEESYDPKKNLQNIEYPQYTRPQEIYWYQVPEILLSWDHKKIQQWKENNEDFETN